MTTFLRYKIKSFAIVLGGATSGDPGAPATLENYYKKKAKAVKTHSLRAIGIIQWK